MWNSRTKTNKSMAEAGLQTPDIPAPPPPPAQQHPTQ